MARKNAQFCQDVRKKISQWDDYFKLNKLQYQAFTDFIFINQWENDQVQVFQKYQKIPFTANKLATLLNHLMGEQRQNTPSLQVEPTDNVSPETADVRQALVREILFNSDSRTIFQTAFQQILVGGYSAIEVFREYEDSRSFEQVIRLDKVDDPTLCFWDIGAKSVDKTDGMHSGKRTRVSREWFAQEYGESLEKKIGSVDPSERFSSDQYNTKTMITLIDYYAREFKNSTLYALSNGRNVTQEQLDDMMRLTIQDADGLDQEVILDNGMPVSVLSQRAIKIGKVKHYQLAGDYILETTDVPCEHLPLVFVDMFSVYDKDGNQVCRPFMKDAKDLQIYLNYLFTQTAYLVKTMRYDQFLVSKENVRSESTQQIWRDPGTVQGALVFDESESGFVPQQLNPSVISPTLVQQMDMCMMNIQTSTGMYDTQIGEKGNEISGAAIDARTKRGNYNTYIAFDSLNRAIACCGCIINEMIPNVYDTQRTMSLELPEKGRTMVSLNQPMDDYNPMVQNNMTEGNYRLKLIPGASYEGAKAESLESLQLVLQASPQIFPLIADLFAENLPIPNALEIKNRLKTIVPPDVIEAGKTGQPLPPQQQQPDPMVIAKMQELQLKQQKLKLEESKLMADIQKSDADRQIALEELELKKIGIAAEMEETILRAQAETHRTNVDHQISVAENLIKLATTPRKEHDRH